MLKLVDVITKLDEYEHMPWYVGGAAVIMTAFLFVYASHLETKKAQELKQAKDQATIYQSEATALRTRMVAVEHESNRFRAEAFDAARRATKAQTRLDAAMARIPALDPVPETDTALASSLIAAGLAEGFRITPPAAGLLGRPDAVRVFEWYESSREVGPLKNAVLEAQGVISARLDETNKLNLALQSQTDATALCNKQTSLQIQVIAEKDKALTASEKQLKAEIFKSRIQIGLAVALGFGLGRIHR